MRLVSRIPAARGRVAAITVHVRCEGLPDGVTVDIADVQLQPGDPTGVVPHPSDVRPTPGAAQWRNGVVTRTEDIIILANSDRAAPTQVRVAGGGSIRVGSFRFGNVIGSAEANGQAGTATQGWGRPPVITERSDVQVRVHIARPTHVTVGWSDRS